MKPYGDIIAGGKKACQVDETGSLVHSVESPPAHQAGSLRRAERTPGEAAVSGVYGREPAGVKSPAGIPWTNSEPPAKSGSFFISGSGPLRGELDAGGGSWSGGSDPLLAFILEAVAKRSAEVKPGLDRDCPAGIITGNCSNGHRFAKEIYCGREWCGTCNGKWQKGRAMLPSHARRFARWYPKAQQFDRAGYWTFTLPKHLRGKYRTKEALGELGHKVQELLKSWGFSRGLRRWHYFGEKSNEWHPHLNCLVDGGYIGGKALRKLRREYSRLLGVKLAIADYHYFDSPGQKCHALTYVTRATFLDWTWDEAMARELHGFRNQLWWGSKLWDRQPVWSLDDLPGERQSDMSDADTRAVASLENGECPHDGLPIDWGRFQPASVLPELGGRSLGAGYWELPYVRPPSYRLDFSLLEQLGYWRRLLSKVLAAESGGAGVADTRLDRLVARHKTFVQLKLGQLESEEADMALLAEVDNLAAGGGFFSPQAKHFGYLTV